MPTYQYACTECAERLEVQQSFTDPPLEECPVCAGRLRKVFNAVGVVFKGSGFYRTDSREGARNGRSDRSADGAGTKTDAATVTTNGKDSAAGKASADKPAGGSSAASTKASDGGSKSTDGGAKKAATSG